MNPATALSYTPSGGWEAPQGLNLFVQKAALSPHNGGVVAVARRGSKNAAEQDELFWGSWNKGGGFSSFTKVGNVGFAVGGPALTSIGVAVELVFLGQDFKHYTAQLGEFGVWSPFGAFPGGKAGEQAFGPSGAGLSSRGVEAWGAHAGENKALYISSKAGPGSSWGFSTAVPSSPLVNTILPVVRAFEGGVTVAYVLEKNGRIALNMLQTPQNVWLGEATVGSNAVTGSDFDFLRLGADDYLVVWCSLDNTEIYYARGGAGSWSAPAVVLSPGQPTSSPVVLPGVGGKIAEVLFTAGGSLRHARYNGTDFEVSEVVATSNAISVSATLLMP